MLGVYASRIGQPVVCMNDVKLFCACHHTCNDRIVVDLLVQVRWIAASKLHTAKVVDVHIVEIGIDMVTQVIIIVGIHHVRDAALYIFVVDITPCNRHTVHSHNAACCLVFIAERTQ